MHRFINKHSFRLLAIILVCAAFLRFYAIDSNPPSLTWDEVSWGYNAYTLGIDGKDEFGVFLPYKYLESFGDFKPPLYAYLDIIPVLVFGLTEFAVRFPSAFFGTLTVLVTYFLTRRIIYKSEYKNEIALMSCLLLALSPWHINLSRAAFEANVSQFFIVSGVWLFLEFVAGKRWLLIISAISFVASLYTFNTARIVSPLLVVLLVVSFYKDLWMYKKQAIIAAIIGVVLIAPVVPFLLSPQASLRFKEVNIFTDLTVITQINQEVANDNGEVWSKIIHHRYLTFGVKYIQHYLDHFDPQFLFIKGDGNPKFSTQQVGQMYLWEMGFFIAGILLLIRKKEGAVWLIPIWLLIGIIPAATARETPHALRIETTLPMFQIITAYGVVVAITKLSSIRKKLVGIPLRYFAIGFTFSLLAVNVAYYLHGYYMHYPREHSEVWQYGYKDSIQYVKEVERDYNQIIVSDIYGRPYNYFVFYLQMDPQTFRQSAKVTRDAFGFVTVSQVGKYQFVREMPVETDPKTLLLAPPYDLPSGSKILKEFKALNGNTVFVAYTIN
jgi:4-amino-4-deoxy-L-arabinose transferase-like glycosyltransferase